MSDLIDVNNDGSGFVGDLNAGEIHLGKIVDFGAWKTHRQQMPVIVRMRLGQSVDRKSFLLGFAIGVQSMAQFHGWNFQKRM